MILNILKQTEYSYRFYSLSFPQIVTRFCSKPFYIIQIFILKYIANASSTYFWAYSSPCYRYQFYIYFPRSIIIRLISSRHAILISGLGCSNILIKGIHILDATIIFNKSSGYCCDFSICFRHSVSISLITSSDGKNRWVSEGYFIRRLRLLLSSSFSFSAETYKNDWNQVSSPFYYIMFIRGFHQYNIHNRIILVIIL